MNELIDILFKVWLVCMTLLVFLLFAIAIIMDLFVNPSQIERFCEHNNLVSAGINSPACSDGIHSYGLVMCKTNKYGWCFDTEINKQGQANG